MKHILHSIRWIEGSTYEVEFTDGTSTLTSRCRLDYSHGFAGFVPEPDIMAMTGIDPRLVGAVLDAFHKARFAGCEP